MSHSQLLLLFFLVAAPFKSIHGGSVLFYMPYVSKSVRITFIPLAEELAARGHQVTIITGQAGDKPSQGVREIFIESLLPNMTRQFSENLLRAGGQKAEWSQFPVLFNNGLITNNNTIRHPEVRQLLADGAKFDVVINSVFVANELGYYLAHKFNSTLILYFTLQCSNVNIDEAMGQPHNPALMQSFCQGFKHPMTFFQRVGNTLMSVLMSRMRDFYVYPVLEKIIDENFPDDSRESRPSLQELETNAGLTLQFGHPLIMDGLRPMSPNYIQVGMMNCRQGKPLPKELQTFLDGSDENGAIFVSFGSVLTASKMSEENRVMLLNVFRRLKQRVLWKWETETMEDKPSNVMLSKWLPQQDVLAHPKVKLFVSHGGQSSCQESLCHQKPMVVVSVFGDQPTNGDEAVHKGYGIHIPFHDVTEENLHAAILELLNNPKYANEARRRGDLLMDQIDKPLERAVWWVEYAMRHPGLRHLRSPVHDLAWYQYFLLDVIAFLATVVILVLSTLYMTCKCLCCRKKSGKKTKQA